MGIFSCGVMSILDSSWIEVPDNSQPGGESIGRKHLLFDEQTG